MKRYALASMLLAATLSGSAWGQTAIQPGTVVGTFAAGNYVPTGTFFTVPNDRNARITDLVVTNYHTAPCTFYLQTSTGVTLSLKASNQQSLVVPLNSGIGLTPGASIFSSGTDCPSVNLYVNIRGYYFTIP